MMALPARQYRNGVPDAVQRPFGGAPQSRDPAINRVLNGPGSAAHYAAKPRRTAQHPGNAGLRPLLRPHQIGKPLEQVVRVARAWRSFRVILHGEYRLAVKRDSAIPAVET